MHMSHFVRRCSAVFEAQLKTPSTMSGVSVPVVANMRKRVAVPRHTQRRHVQAMYSHGRQDINGSKSNLASLSHRHDQSFTANACCAQAHSRSLLVAMQSLYSVSAAVYPSACVALPVAVAGGVHYESNANTRRHRRTYSHHHWRQSKP